MCNDTLVAERLRVASAARRAHGMVGTPPSWPLNPVNVDHHQLLRYHIQNAPLQPEPQNVRVWHQLHSARIGLVGTPSSWLVASLPSSAAVKAAWGPSLVDVPIEVIDLWGFLGFFVASGVAKG